ncbi:hypothetical protein ASF84_20700 [Pseudomonas sp. Leaf127]|uniref:RDD family protein n=1 Tax=Pseudomonas sp. Leaf127 TaxID=1736267 RepID=UPI000702797F|nr:RDD family protein [Pseudomonas sp. Leaf127]KQQ50694.1 hypothetical protein ASF84_20700 [Pseudomonas sp. Leaf127]
MPTHLLQPQGAFAPAPLLRRLAAAGYDLLLCLAILIVTAFIYKLIWMVFVGQARLRQLSDSGAMDGDPVLSTLLLLAAFAFYGGFWTRSGQTLGMQAWGVRVQNADGSAISLTQALLRFMVAIASALCFGAGFFWSLYDRQGRTWHDRYSNSVLVRLPARG